MLSIVSSADRSDSPAVPGDAIWAGMVPSARAADRRIAVARFCHLHRWSESSRPNILTIMTVESLTPPSPFSAIIFDCDGTLVDTARVYHRAYNAVLQGRGGEMAEEWYFARLGLSAEALLREYSSAFEHQLEPAELMEPIAEAYQRGMEDVRVIEVVADVARRFHGRVPMAVASAGKREIVEATLQAAGMRELFAAVVTIEDVDGRTKPAPDLFLEAARRLDVPPGECTVFEDTDEGLEAARRAGMTVTDVRSVYRHEWRDVLEG